VVTAEADWLDSPEELDPLEDSLELDPDSLEDSLADGVLDVPADSEPLVLVVEAVLAPTVAVAARRWAAADRAGSCPEASWT